MLIHGGTIGSDLSPLSSQPSIGPVSIPQPSRKANPPLPRRLLFRSKTGHFRAGIAFLRLLSRGILAQSPRHFKALVWSDLRQRAISCPLIRSSADTAVILER
jgi:hypothetical protein